MTDEPEPFYTSGLASDANPILRFVHGRRLGTDVRTARRFGGPDRSFLDFGCGDGLVVRGAADAYKHAVGVDTNPGAIAAALRLGVPFNAAFGLVNEIDDLAGRYGPFDTVGIFQVLEHVSDEVRDRIFDTFRRTTNPNATIIVEVPIESGPILLVKNIGAHVLTRVTRNRYKRHLLTGREVLQRLSIRRAPHVRPPQENPKGRTTFGHKDFSVWNLKTYIEEQCRIVETRFLPLNALGWVNLQAMFVCTWREV